MTLDALNKTVEGLRLQLVGCDSRCCEGVQPVSPSDGHVPRIIYLEPGEDRGANVIVVGMNPGGPDDDERGVVRGVTSADSSTIAAALYSFFTTKILLKHPYCKRVRHAVRGLGFRGAILWTEAVKCSSTANGSLSVMRTPATFRTCGARWLQRELADVPADWPIVAVGQDAFVASLLLSPRRVLGIPHATAAKSPAFWRVFHSTGGEAYKVDEVLEDKIADWNSGKTKTLMLTLGARKTGPKSRSTATAVTKSKRKKK